MAGGFGLPPGGFGLLDGGFGFPGRDGFGFGFFPFGGFGFRRHSEMMTRATRKRSRKVSFMPSWLRSTEF